MRIRSLKPHVWEDEKIGRLSREARLLFVGLITQADDEGRFRALASVIRGRVYPYDNDAERKIPKWLAELEACGLIVLYGGVYGCFPNWKKHQRISHMTPSILPNPNGAIPAALANDSGGFPE